MMIGLKSFVFRQMSQIKKNMQLISCCIFQHVFLVFISDCLTDKFDIWPFVSQKLIFHTSGAMYGNNLLV